MDVSGSEEGREERYFKCECRADIEGSAHILSSSSQECFVHVLFEVGVEQRFSGTTELMVVFSGGCMQ